MCKEALEDVLAQLQRDEENEILSITNMVLP